MSVGDLIRALRAAHGWSQGRLADALNEISGANLGREYISKWESGKVTPGPYWLRHLATALEIPIVTLESGMRRRQFLTAAASTAIAPHIAADLIGAGFAAALHAAPSADEWEATLASYGHDYMTMGAAEIQQRLTSELLIIQRQLETPRLWSVASRLMTLYAKTFPGSDGSKALHWYNLAVQAADKSGDLDARVWVRGRAAIALGYEGASLGVARLFADQALEIDDRPSIGRLHALMGAAHACAIAGDRTMALELAGKGRQVFDVAGSEEQMSDYAVPWWRMNVFLSLLLARLGDERGALAAQEQATSELPATLPRFATHLRMHTGLMLVRAGDRDTGVRVAQQALDDLPPEKHSLTLRMLMAEISTQSPPRA